MPFDPIGNQPQPGGDGPVPGRAAVDGKGLGVRRAAAEDGRSSVCHAPRAVASRPEMVVVLHPDQMLAGRVEIHRPAPRPEPVRPPSSAVGASISSTDGLGGMSGWDVTVTLTVGATAIGRCLSTPSAISRSPAVMVPFPGAQPWTAKDSVCDVRPLKTAEVRSATRRVQSLRAPRWSLYCTRIKCWRAGSRFTACTETRACAPPFERGRRVDQLDRRPRWNVDRCRGPPCIAETGDVLAEFETANAVRRPRELQIQQRSPSNAPRRSNDRSNRLKPYNCRPS